MRRLPNAIACLCLFLYLEALRAHYDIYTQKPDLDECPQAAIGFVQSKALGFNNSSSAQSLTFTSNVTAGDFIVVAVSTFTGSALTLTCTDTLSNTYKSLLNYPVFIGSSQLNIFYAPNVIGGACTVTVNPNGTSVYMGLGIHEYSGVSWIYQIDSWASRSQSAQTNATAGIPPIPRANDGLFAAFTQSAGTINGSAGAGFTLRANLNNSSTAMTLFTEDQFGLSSDTDTPFTFASSVNYIGLSFTMRATFAPTSKIQPVTGQAGGFQYAPGTSNTYSSLARTYTFPNATTTGDLLVTVVGTNSADGNNLSTNVTDNKGNTWTQVTATSDTSLAFERVEIWYVILGTGGSNHTVTVTPTGPIKLTFGCNEWTGVGGVTNLVANNSGTTTSPTSGNFTTSPNLLTIGAMAEFNTPGVTAAYQHSIGIESGWTNVFTAPGDAVPSAMGLSFITFGDQTNDPGQTLAATWTFADSQSWVVASATFSAQTSSSSSSSSGSSIASSSSPKISSISSPSPLTSPSSSIQQSSLSSAHPVSSLPSSQQPSSIQSSLQSSLGSSQVSSLSSRSSQPSIQISSLSSVSQKASSLSPQSSSSLTISSSVSPSSLPSGIGVIVLDIIRFIEIPIDDFNAH